MGKLRLQDFARGLGGSAEVVVKFKLILAVGLTRSGFDTLDPGLFSALEAWSKTRRRNADEEYLHSR